MKLIERVLVATDFSPAANQAVAAAEMLARHFRSKLCLVHVLPGSVDICSSRGQPIEGQVAARLESAAEDLRSRGLAVRAILRRGEAAEQIRSQAEEHRANVIVIGGGRRAADGVFQLGETAERLRRLTPKPLWMVKPDGSTRIRRVLCPVDFSSASARALRNAIHLARQLSAELTVLTVMPALAGGEAPPPGWHSGMEVSADRHYQTAWERFVGRFDWEGVRWRATVRRGRPRREIVRAAEESRADLMVMGSEGRSGLFSLFVGGVARGVAQQLPCSLLTVRSEEPVQLRSGQAAAMDPQACARRQDPATCPRFRYGQQLLELGFPEQAMRHFQECIEGYGLCADAWSSLGTAQRRLGHGQEAEECQRRSEQVVQRLLDRQIQAEVRGQHLLYRPMFGIK